MGSPLPIDAAIASDGVDELFEEFGPDNPFFKGAGTKFAGDGETFRFEATDIDSARTVTARPNTFEFSQSGGSGDVIARGSASDLLLFVWGRVRASTLEVSGDAALLDRWQELVKI